MSDADKWELLSKIAERLDNHVDRYDRDRVEAMERIENENAAKDTFRQAIEGKVDDLKDQIGAIKDQIAPVVKDHKWVMGAGKVLGLGLLGGAATWILKWVEAHWR